MSDIRSRRGPWSAVEDSRLLQLVQTHGPHNWVRIANLVGTRTPKQCRERFHQNLKPTLNHEPITPEEGELIERLVREVGKRWAEIARRLPGRSDNAVKNWWNGGVNRRRRSVIRTQAAARRDSVPTQLAPISPLYSTPQHSRAFSTSITLPPIDPALSNSYTSPLPSPSMLSEFSRNSTPSLMSDAGSTASASPRLPASPVYNHTQLPPILPDARSFAYNEHSKPQQSSPYGYYSHSGMEYAYRSDISLPQTLEPSSPRSDSRMALNSILA